MNQVGAARAAMDGGRPVAVADTTDDAVCSRFQARGGSGRGLAYPCEQQLDLASGSARPSSRLASARADLMLAGEAARASRRFRIGHNYRGCVRATARAHGAAFASGLADDEPERAAETVGA